MHIKEYQAVVAAIAAGEPVDYRIDNEEAPWRDLAYDPEDFLFRSDYVYRPHPLTDLERWWKMQPKVAGVDPYYYRMIEDHCVPASVAEAIWDAARDEENNLP